MAYDKKYDVLETDELITHAQAIVEDADFAYRNARKPKNKRTYKRQLEFWTSILGRLMTLQEKEVENEA